MFPQGQANGETGHRLETEEVMALYIARYTVVFRDGTTQRDSKEIRGATLAAAKKAFLARNKGRVKNVTVTKAKEQRRADWPFHV